MQALMSPTPFHHSVKMAKVPVLVVGLACIAAILFLLSSMFLLSSIITWLSLEFSGPLPHIVGFVIGILSLFDAFIAILMIGISHMRKSLGFIFMIMSVITLLTSIGLLVPYILSFTAFCNECNQIEQTSECVDTCSDECCFTDLSMPLAITFITCSCVALFSSLLGLSVSVPYIWYTFTRHTSKQH